LYHARRNRRKLASDRFFWGFIFPNLLFYNFIHPLLILKSNDVERNPGPFSKAKCIEMGHANVRSLTSQVTDPNHESKKICKFDLVKHHILNYKYDIFGISETWLDENNKVDLNITGYLHFRKDYNRNQRGIMVYVSQTLPARRREDLEPPSSEIIAVEIQVSKCKLLICNCYRVQSYSITDFCNDIHTLLEMATPDFNGVVIMGDMNARNSAFWCDDVTNTEGRALLTAMSNEGLNELIHEPTRIVGDRMSCLDLVFTTSLDFITEAGVRSKIIEVCDHCPIYASLKFQKNAPRAYKRWVWDFKRGSYDAFRYSILHADWNSCYVNKDVNSTVSNWMSLLEQYAEANIPHYEATIRPRDKAFMQSSIRKLMHKRDKLYKQYKLTQNEETGIAYRRCRNEVVSAIRLAKRAHESKLDAGISNASHTSSAWWKTCKNALGTQQRTFEGPLLHGKQLISDDQLKANLLNCYFASQTILETTQAAPEGRPSSASATISSVVSQPEEVYKILLSLDPQKATGPDGIGNKILKEVALPLSKPLSELFNFCLSQGTYPEQWKVAQVIPIHKKGDRTQCSNYRPISLLPCISKVFERVLFNHIFDFLRTNSLINKHQSGFIPGDSTVNQLITICHKLHYHMDIKEDVIAIFLDLTKAFDRVWHGGLLYKLEEIGVTGLLLKLISSYLTNRRQYVVLHGCISDEKEIMAGVPQGSVLGPLLFLIYINDIDKDVTNDTFLFADDSSLFCPVKTGDIKSAAEKVNRDLELISNWAAKWHVTINPNKTEAMLFSRKWHPPILPHLILDGKQLQVVPTHKHLGMVLSSSLNWSHHIKSLVLKCGRLLAILKSYKYRWSRESLDTCYKSFIRPIIEYGNILYDSCTVSQCKDLEDLQKEAARVVTGTKRGTSPQRLLEDLGWSTLESRRKNAKLIKMYEIATGVAPKHLRDILQTFSLQEHYNTRGHSANNFTMPPYESKPYYRSFFVSGIKSWNALDAHIKRSPTLVSFKREINKSATKAKLFPSKISRKLQVAFMQLRYSFSDLKGHLYAKGCSSSGECMCGAALEDTKHYLLGCPRFSTVRTVLFDKIKLLTDKTPTVALLLFGKTDLSEIENITIFEYVCEYIDESGRFQK